MEQNLRRMARQVVAEILDLEPSVISDETSVDNTPKWDSATHIQLVLALEQEFSIVFEVTELESMLTFRAIVEMVEAKV